MDSNVPGPKGDPGDPGTKWFVQEGRPSVATGIKGDLSLDSSTGDFYEKTNATTWTLRGNLRGPPGKQGKQEYD